jgi:predicted transposase YbfD/YdcC
MFYQSNHSDEHQTVEKNRGRNEIRRCRVFYDISDMVYAKDWESIKCIVEIESRIEEKGKCSEEKRYYISSYKGTAEEMQKIARNHWQVEVMHHILDVTFKEDDCKVKLGNAPENLSTIRKLILNALNGIKEKRVSRPRMMKRIGWSKTELRKFIGAILNN